MKTEYKIFGTVAAFLFVAGSVYVWWTARVFGGTPDYVGALALLLSGLLCLMCAWYFWFVSRRIDPRPEDRPDAEIADAAGEVGFFSPGSYFPFGISVAVVVAGLGLVYLHWWLVAAGITGILVGTAGLLFEYYTGARRAD